MSEGITATIKPLAIVESEYILFALNLFDGHRANTAKALGISNVGLRIKLRQYEKQGMVIPQSKYMPGTKPPDTSLPVASPIYKRRLGL